MVDEPKRIVATYVLSAPTTKVSNLVADSIPRTNKPVAIGSNVPA
jgi:hypothetical protein